MTALSPELEKNLRTLVLKYLQGASDGATLFEFQRICDESQTDCTTLLSLTLLKHPPTQSPFKAILGSLNIGEAEQKTLLKKSRNFYQLLTGLYQSDHHQIGDLLNLIHKARPQKNRALTYFLGSMLIAGMGLFLHFQRAYVNMALNWIQQRFPVAVRWLTQTFSILRNLSLLGLLTNSLSLGWNWYTTFSNTATSTQQKLGALAFKTLTSGLTIAAYTLSYLAGGAVPMAAVLLFTLSAGVDIFESLYRFYSINAQANALKETGGDSISARAERLRINNFNQRSSKTLWVKLGTGALSMLAVGIWNFYPPNLIVTISCVSFMALLSGFKNAFNQSTDDAASKDLQTALNNLYANEENASDPPPGPDSNPFNALLSENRQLVSEMRELLSENRQLVSEMREVNARNQAEGTERVKELKNANHPPDSSEGPSVPNQLPEQENLEPPKLLRSQSSPSFFGEYQPDFECERGHYSQASMPNCIGVSGQNH